MLCTVCHVEVEVHIHEYVHVYHVKLHDVYRCVPHEHSYIHVLHVYGGTIDGTVCMYNI